MTNSVVPVSANTSKLMAFIGDSNSPQMSSKLLSQAFPVDVVGISNKVCIPKDKERTYEFILNTEYSLIFA